MIKSEDIILIFFFYVDKCILEEPASMQHNGPIAYLNMDLKNLQYVEE